VLNTSKAWHIKRRNKVQLSEKHREKRVFDKIELKELLLAVLVCVAVGCGNVSSSTGVSTGDTCEICLSSS
jgi:hypothetical protein